MNANIRHNYSKNHTRFANRSVHGMTEPVLELSALVNKPRLTAFQYWKSIRLSKKFIKLEKNSELLGEEDPRPHATILINTYKTEVRGLLDSGASISCFGQDVAATLAKCGLAYKPNKGSSVITACGKPQNILGYTDVLVTFQSVTKRIRFYIIPTLESKKFLVPVIPKIKKNGSASKNRKFKNIGSEIPVNP